MIVASGIPAFCSVSDNARDAFVLLLVKPFSLFLFFLLAPSLEISCQYFDVTLLDENREIRVVE